MKEQSVYQQLRSHLAYLRLSAAAEQLAVALEDAEKRKLSYTRFLERLLAVEVEATERRRLEGRLRFASFPTPKTLADIDYDAQPALDRKLVDELATLRFVEEHGNVLLIGPPGVGKTMLAVALGRHAAEAGHRVYYTTAADLVAKTQRAALEGRWQTTMRFWNGPAAADDRRARLPPAAGGGRRATSSRSSPAATSTARSSSPPTAASPTGARSSTTHRRRRHPRPAPPPRHRPHDQRAQLPDAPPPRPRRTTPRRPPSRRTGQALSRARRSQGARTPLNAPKPSGRGQRQPNRPDRSRPPPPPAGHPRPSAALSQRPYRGGEFP